MKGLQDVTTHRTSRLRKLTASSWAASSLNGSLTFPSTQPLKHHQPNSNSSKCLPKPPTPPPQSSTLPNLSGTPTPYTIGADVALPSSLNDKYQSVSVGASAKSSRVTRAVAFAFKDATGGKKKQYSLKVEAREVGTVTIYPGKRQRAREEYRLVGIMPEGGPPVTTAVYVRDEASGAYVALGSVYFQWNEKEDRVDIVENENWPVQLKQERTGASQFVVTLVDSTPSS
ncbi:hypothetical protein N0V88_006751 [Collariella sp. IMI 366227]|nr:hypothetical protein N0V88_006751 [Collariella sp. IMI 366227]